MGKSKLIRRNNFLETHIPTHLVQPSTCVGLNYETHRVTSTALSPRDTTGADTYRTTTRESANRLTGYKQSFINQNTISSHRGYMSHRNLKIQEKGLNAKNAARLLSPSIQIHNSVRGLRPTKVQPLEGQDSGAANVENTQPVGKGKEEKKSKKPPSRGKARQVEAEVPKEDTKDRDLEVLDEPSFIDENSISQLDVDDYQDIHRKKVNFIHTAMFLII